MNASACRFLQPRFAIGLILRRLDSFEFSVPVKLAKPHPIKASVKTQAFATLTLKRGIVHAEVKSQTLIG